VRSADKLLAVVPFAILAVVALVVAPSYMFADSMNAEVVSAYGQWYGDAVIATASIFAIYQLFLTKKASESDVFLKICQMIDDKEFDRCYKYICIRQDELLRDVVKHNGIDAFKDDACYDELKDAVIAVLYTLEKIGILVHHAVVNKRMVTDYVGACTIKSYDVLSQAVAYLQREDAKQYEYFVKLHKTCKQNRSLAVCRTDG
jgi:hypothetical protein